MRAMVRSGITSEAAWSVRSGSEAETIALGRQLGALLKAGDVVLLFAPFGAGKTHLTKGIAAALGVDQADVNSPSFVLINEYEADRAHGRISIFHVDLYRIETADELATVGLDDVLIGDGIAIVEWAEHAAEWSPREHLAIRIEHTGESERCIYFIPHGQRYRAIIEELRAASSSLKTR